MVEVDEGIFFLLIRLSFARKRLIFRASALRLGQGVLLLAFVPAWLLADEVSRQGLLVLCDVRKTAAQRRLRKKYRDCNFQYPRFGCTLVLLLSKGSTATGGSGASIFGQGGVNS